RQLEILDPKHGAFRQKIQKGLPDLTQHLGLYIWYDADLPDRSNRELVFGIKGPNTFYFPTKKLNSERKFIGIGEHINNAPSNGKLTGLIYKISLLEFVSTKQFRHEFNVNFFPYFRRES